MKAAVVVAAAHTYTMSIAVERSEWSNDDVELSGVYGCFSDGFENSESPSLDSAIGSQRTKLKAIMIVNDWRINFLFCAPAAQNDFVCIDFIPG